MPGHFTHVYTARRVAELLEKGFKDWPPRSGLSPEALGSIMKKWPKFTATGAVGPDLFYFSQDYNNELLGPRSDELMLMLAVYYFYDFSKENDWEPLLIILGEVNETLAAVVRFLLELDKIWKKFKQGWDDTIGPFVDAADAALDNLTGGLLSAFGDTLKELVAGLKTLAQLEISTYADVFTGFDTCVAKGFDEKSFLWSDMTHYRGTTALARSFVEMAGQANDLPGDGDWPTPPDDGDQPNCPDSDNRQEQFMAFALGWITHIGLDTIAHSFVNEQCGGPFRHHPQRHHLIENHIDAWNYRQAGAGTGNFTQDDIGATNAFPDLSNSAFWYEVQFTPGNPCGNERPTELSDDEKTARQQVDKDGVMPMWMANGIVQAMINTYGRDEDAPPLGQPPIRPRIFGGSDFQNAIDENLLTDIVQKITGQGLDRAFEDLLHDVAPTPPFHVPPGYPLPWQVRTIYFFMSTFFKLSFWGGWELAKPRTPQFIITPPSKDIDDLLQPPDFSGPSSGDPVEDVCDAIKSFFDWVEHEVDAALKLIGDLVKMAASPGSYLFRLGLYKLAMMVWDIVCKTHEIMAHTGFVMPHGDQHYADNPDELKLPNEIDLPLITLGSSTDAAFKQALADAIDPLGNLDRNLGLIVDHPVDDENYPYFPVMQMTTNDTPVAGKTMPWATDDTIIPEEYHRPWAYPKQSPDVTLHLQNTPTEKYDPTLPGNDLGPDGQPPPFDDSDHLLPGPYPAGSTPDVFFADRPPNRAARADYETAPTPRKTDALNKEHLLTGDQPGSPLGDPVPFAAYLIGQIANNPEYNTQFNLDSDRAYAYLTWDWIRRQPDRATPGSIAKDDMGREFAAPETWPALAPNFVQPPNGPDTRIHVEYIPGPQPAKPDAARENPR